jgi:Rieske Fe-S protein
MEEELMAVCEVCGNDYDKAFEVRAGGAVHTFDSFECAIQALAPTCAHCGCRVIGHGVEANGIIFCCAHCAQQEGVAELRDRV